MVGAAAARGATGPAKIVTVRAGILALGVAILSFEMCRLIVIARRGGPFNIFMITFDSSEGCRIYGRGVLSDLLDRMRVSPVRGRLMWTIFYVGGLIAPGPVQVSAGARMCV